MQRSHNNGNFKNPCYNASKQFQLEDNTMPFAQKLSTLRNERGLTQQEMANLIGSDEHAQVRNSLHDRILDWMDTTRDPFRGPVWANRPWRGDIQGWKGSGKTRPRKDDGYEPRMLLYGTGLPVDKWEYDK